MNGALVTGPGARIVTGALVTPPPPVKGALVPSARDSIAATMRRTGPDGGFTGPLPPKNYYHEAVLADTPALFWTFDESSGNYADASGNGHVGTAAATIVRVPGRITGGLAVNGDAQTAMVTTPNSAALNTAPLTFEFWWRHGGAVGQYGMTVIKTSDGNWQDGYGAYWQSANLQFFHSSYGMTLAPPVAPPANTWMHYAYSVDAAGVGVLIENGAQVGTHTYTVAGVAVPGPFGVFDNGVAGGALNNGDVDCVAVYPKVLTPAQVLAHYNAASM